MLRKIGLSLSLTTLCLAAATTYAATSKGTVCVKADGTIIIRSKCKRSETLLSSQSLNQQISVSQEASGLAGPSGLIGVQGAIGPDGAMGAQGPVGPKGPRGQIDLSACHASSQAYDTNFFSTSNPILYAESFCDQNTEYILEDEASVSPFPDSVGTKSILQGRFPYHKSIGGDKREYGVGYYANRYLVVGTGAFQISVRAICCPR